MSAAAVDVEALLRPERRDRGPEADGFWNLLAPARGLAARSRRLYSRAPFDHRDPPGAPGAFDRGLSPLARRLGDVLPKAGAVLEAGSGPGHATRWLRDRGVPVVALDQSVACLRAVRERTSAPTVAADVTDLPFRDATFDAVVADGVVHHAARPARAIAELLRVLRPGGLLFLRVYRAEGRYPAIHRTVGGALRALDALPPLDRVPWRLAFPAYRALADARDRRAGREPGRHDEGVFADYFLSPRATPMRGSTLLASLRRAGLEVLAYERFGNAHGFLARRRGAPS